MNSDENIISAADMIATVFSNIDKNDFEQSNKLFNSWNSVVGKVKSQERDYGAQLIAHTTPVDLKNVILFVEADHSGWIQILQLYSKFILKGLRLKIPELKISSLAFRLKGSDARLFEKTYDEQIAEERRKLEELAHEEDINSSTVISKKLQKSHIVQDSKQAQKRILPPELLKKIAEIKTAVNEKITTP